ncbi:Histidine ammonia-lyase [marine metagenome]
MIAEVTTAALMSENKHLANPCTTDSTPTSANQEDHVSMAAHAARRLVRMNANLSVIIGVEAMCGAQGIEFRAPLKTSTALCDAIATLRKEVPTMEKDRYMAPSIEAAAKLVSSGNLTGSVALPSFVKGYIE